MRTTTSYPEGPDVRVKLEDTPLKRLGGPAPAGLATISMPWPPVPQEALSLSGLPTHMTPLARWPGADAPRRLLMMADLADGQPPETLSVTTGAVDTDKVPPQASAVCFARSPDPGFVWERHFLEIRTEQKRLGIAMGLRTQGRVHWWEACRLTVVEETPFCRTIEMGGAIPHTLTDGRILTDYTGYENPWLHVHNWLNGHLFLRLHANGVCEVYAHHINSRFFDDGRDLEDTVPVIGFKVTDADDTTLACPSTWDGTISDFRLGDVSFDVSEAARLATPEHPGRIDEEDGFVVWQPYMGAALYGGVCPQQRTGDSWILRPEKRLFPRGMSRTLRFSFSLSDRPPRVARYLAPWWWYGLTRELNHASLLPVGNDEDWRLDACATWVRHAITQGGFEDGAVPRKAPFDAEQPVAGPHEPGWAGDVPYAQLLLAYRSGRDDDYLFALRSAYHMADVVTDHAAKMMRMHGYAPVAFSLPMNRVLGMISAYLETGDPYLLSAAEALTEAGYRTHLNSWPRLAVGRDACFVRGAVMLYRYFDNNHFLRIAREGCMSIAQSQRPDGSFGDQGGGTGIHQWAGYISKAWMACLGTSCVLDYLDIFPDDEELAACIMRLADWLLATAWARDGIFGWSYQHDFDGRSEYYSPTNGSLVQLPTRGQWHQDQIGRIMLFASLRSGRSNYFDAWAHSLESIGPVETGHTMVATAEFLPWIQARLWAGTIAPEGFKLTPVHAGARTPTSGKLNMPEGQVAVTWHDTTASVSSPSTNICSTRVLETQK